ELAGVVSGAWAEVFGLHAQAVVDDDGPALDEVAGRFETMGAVLHAAEAATQAAGAHEGTGLRARQSISTARAVALVAQCEGASTPALTERIAPVRLTRREREIAERAA